MHVVFLEVDTERTWAVSSIGPSFLAAYLRRHGHEASLVRVPLDADLTTVADRVRSLAPGLLGVSLTTRQWQRAREVVPALRGQLDIPVIAGGLHPTFSPEDVLSQPGFDYVCLGEGEEALVELVGALESDGGMTRPIPNIWPRGASRPVVRPPLSPLDDLPPAARDLLDEQPGVIHISTQRGCPFPCTYCAASQYNALYERTSLYGRRRSPASIVAEIEAIRRESPVYYLIFLDDTFTIHPSWVQEFCDLYGPRLGLPFSLHARSDTVDAAMLKRLADAGCRHIVYGIESGSPRLRREVMQRPIENQRMIDAASATREAGIMVTTNYMVGLPTETPDDVEQTFALHAELRPFDFGYFVFYPFPGTRLFEYCRQQGLLPDDYLDRPANLRESILSGLSLTAEQIAGYYDRFTVLREELYAARLRPTVDAATRRDVAQAIRASAAVG